MYSLVKHLCISTLIFVALSLDAFSAIRVDRTVPNIPDQYVQNISETISEISNSYRPRLIVPTNVLVVVDSYESGNAKFSYTNPETFEHSLSIRLGYRYRDKSNKLFEGSEMMPLVAHEFGHYVFHLNLLKKLPGMRAFVGNFLELKKRLFNIENQRRAPGELTDKAEQQRRALELNAEWNRVSAALDPMRRNNSLTMIYHELFADLTAALQFDDPNIIMSFCDPNTPLCQARSMTNNLGWSSFSGADVHGILAPSRKLIWDLYLAGMPKPELADLVTDVAAIEIRKYWNRYGEISVQEFNTSFSETVLRLVRPK